MKKIIIFFDFFFKFDSKKSCNVHYDKTCKALEADGNSQEMLLP